MADKKVDIDINASDKTGPAFASVKKGLKDVGGEIESIKGFYTAFAALGAASGITALFASAIESGARAEQSTAKLNAVLRATGDTTGFTHDKLEEMAGAMARATNFDDEGAREAMATLAKFGNLHSEVFEKALKFSADYAAMTGSDLPAAAQTIGRALSDPINGVKALQKEFGTLSATEKQAIQTAMEHGNIAEAQAVILNKLKTSIGGTAEEMHSGLTGSLHDARDAWSELLEAMGRSGPIKTVVEGALGPITLMVDGLREALEKQNKEAEKSLLFNGQLKPLPPAVNAPPPKPNQGLENVPQGMTIAEVAARSAAVKAQQEEEARRKDEQHDKDMDGARKFVAGLQEQSNALSMSKGKLLEWKAAQEAAKTVSSDVAEWILRQADAIGRQITALEKSKAETEALTKADQQVADARENAINAAIKEIESLDAQAAAAKVMNDARGSSAVLLALEAAGVDRSSDAYRNLESALNRSSSELDRANQMREASKKREEALAGIEREIEAIRFETATLRLNSDERERAIALRKLQQEGVPFDNPQAAEQMDQLDEAIAARKRERDAMLREEKRRQLDEDGAALIMSLATDEEAEINSFLSRSQMLAQLYGERLVTERQYESARQRLGEDHAKKMTAIEDAELKKRWGITNVYRKADLDSASFFFNQMGALMQTKSRAMFEIGKASAIAGAVVDTYRAANGAYAALAGIPIIGPALGIAAAAAAVAVGISRVQAIKSQSFGSGSSAVGVFSASPSTGLPESPTDSGFQAPPQSPLAAPASATPLPARNINITIRGEGMFSMQQIRDDLIPLLNEAVGDGVTLTAN